MTKTDAAERQADGQPSQGDDGGGRLEQPENGEDEAFGDPAACWTDGGAEPGEQQEREKGEGGAVVPSKVRGEDLLEGDGGSGKEEQQEGGGCRGVDGQTDGEDVPKSRGRTSPRRAGAQAAATGLPSESRSARALAAAYGRPTGVSTWRCGQRPCRSWCPEIIGSRASLR
jgi:hypothetical protein